MNSMVDLSIVILVYQRVAQTSGFPFQYLPRLLHQADMSKSLSLAAGATDPDVRKAGPGLRQKTLGL